jgi:hypothetical protein
MNGEAARPTPRTTIFFIIGEAVLKEYLEWYCVYAGGSQYDQGLLRYNAVLPLCL